MILNRENVSRGSIPVGRNADHASPTPAPTGLPNPPVEWGTLAAGADNTVLICLSTVAEGVAWSNTLSVTSLTASGGIAAWGASPPGAARDHRHGHRIHGRLINRGHRGQHVYRPHGRSAYTIGDIVLALKQQGLLAL